MFWFMSSKYAFYQYAQNIDESTQHLAFLRCNYSFFYVLITGANVKNAANELIIW